MIKYVDNVKIMLEKVVKIKPGQNLLVITDTYAKSKAIAHAVTEVANSIGVQTVLTMMEPLTHIGQEPPPSVSAAMKAADVIIEFGENSTSGHSTAKKEATEAGVKYYNLHTDVSEDYLRTPITLEDLNRIKKQTESLAEIMTRASIARVTTHYGTDITMTLEGRRAIPIHPLAEGGVRSLQDYAEAAISPVEGTTEGVVVADASIRGWGYVLRAPIRFEVTRGRVQAETVSSDSKEETERFKKIVLFDPNASNCAAELGLGTSHTVPRILRGDAMRDYAMAGNIHIAVGRNNDIGGVTWSEIHTDVLMTRATVSLDGVHVIEDGTLLI
jgi:2,5-dihydroxypyridine 5,6-dioxygenase